MGHHSILPFFRSDLHVSSDLFHEFPFVQLPILDVQDSGQQMIDESMMMMKINHDDDDDDDDDDDGDGDGDDDDDDDDEETNETNETDHTVLLVRRTQKSSRNSEQTMNITKPVKGKPF